MEPDYTSLDPEDRTNKFLALFSIVLGMFSLCAGLIPICGGISSLVGIVVGIPGMKSERHNLAVVGVAISALGLLLSIVYAVLLFIGKR